MLIQVGIHENLKLSSDTKINEHGTLELAIESVQDTSALLATFQNNSASGAMKSSFRFYPPSLTDYDKNLKSAGDIAGDINIIKMQLMSIARLFAPQETVEAYIGGIKLLEGIGVPPEQYAAALEQLNQEAFLAKVMKNLVTRFLDFLTKANAFSGNITFRMKFLRQSQLKNYAVIPKSTFDTWIEPMTIPKAQSKIGWSDYEIDKGLNNPNPASADAPEAKEPVAAIPAKELFGNTEEAAPATQAPAIGFGNPAVAPATQAAPVQPVTPPAQQPDLTAAAAQIPVQAEVVKADPVFNADGTPSPETVAATALPGETPEAKPAVNAGGFFGQ